MVICVSFNYKKWIKINNMIAFCFLTYTDIERIDIWNNFFQNIDINEYSVTIHSKYPNKISKNLYKFPINIINNPIQTFSKTDISIVNATIKLFEVSLNNNSSHYIFLSQSCIPVYNFEIIKKIIINSDKSIISNIKNNKKERYNQLSNQLKKHISYESFTKQQPNMILTLNDVKKILETKDLAKHFSNMQCPDEHYFINILILCKSDIIFNQIVFCNYNLAMTQALEFININDDLLKNIRKNGFLFMRKASKKSIISGNLFNSNINSR